MEQSSAQVVRSLYRAINQGDEHGIGACFAEDAAWHGSSREVRGRDATTRLIGDLVAASDGSLAIELHDVVASEAHVVALQTTRAVRAGRRLEDRVVYVFHVADGGSTTRGSAAIRASRTSSGRIDDRSAWSLLGSAE